MPGYHCVSVGKMHTIPYDAKAGFHERFVVENKDRFYEGRWFADELDKAHRGARADETVAGRLPGAARLPRPAGSGGLDAAEQSAPRCLRRRTWRAGGWRRGPSPSRLFLQVGFPGPHPPYDPPAEYTQRYLDNPDLPLPHVTQAELDALPEYLKEKRRHDVEVDHDSVAWKAEPSEDNCAACGRITAPTSP